MAEVRFARLEYTNAKIINYLVEIISEDVNNYTFKVISCSDPSWNGRTTESGSKNTVILTPLTVSTLEKIIYGVE